MTEAIAMARRMLPALLVSLVVLVGCGGGTGSVTVTVTSPARFDAVIYEGQYVPELMITARLSGDVSSLNGRTLYMIAVVPDAFLFSGTPAVNVDSDGLGGRLQLFGAIPPDVVTTYAGAVHLRACLDPGCSSELRVVNGDVPYSVTVKQGVTVATAAVTLSTTFGTLPTPLTLPVTLPEGVRSWDVQSGSVTVVQKSPDVSPSVVVSAAVLELPNTSYRDSLTISAVTPDGQTLTRSVPATYTTSPSAIPWAFQRPDVSITIPQGYGYLTPEPPLAAGALFPASDSDAFRYVGVTFSWPPAADTFPYPTAWYGAHTDEGSTPRLPLPHYSVEVQATGCVWQNTTPTCLPPGHYEAVQHFRYSPPGTVPVDAYQTVKLDILP